MAPPIITYKQFILLTLTLSTNQPVEITPDKIAENNADIEQQYLREVVGYKRERHAEVIKRICHTVGKTAHDKQRHTKEKREVLTLTRKGYRRSHDKAAAYCEHTTIKRTCGKATFENLLSCGL